MGGGASGRCGLLPAPLAAAAAAAAAAAPLVLALVLVLLLLLLEPVWLSGKGATGDMLCCAAWYYWLCRVCVGV